MPKAFAHAKTHHILALLEAAWLADERVALLSPHVFQYAGRTINTPSGFTGVNRRYPSTSLPGLLAVTMRTYYRRTAVCTLTQSREKQVETPPDGADMAAPIAHFKTIENSYLRLFSVKVLCLRNRAQQNAARDQPIDEFCLKRNPVTLKRNLPVT